MIREMKREEERRVRGKRDRRGERGREGEERESRRGRGMEGEIDRYGGRKHVRLGRAAELERQTMRDGRRYGYIYIYIYMEEGEREEELLH